jgi:hypothetical protein
LRVIWFIGIKSPEIVFEYLVDIISYITIFYAIMHEYYKSGKECHLVH